MKRACLVGVDIGTQGTKAALFDLRGKTHATAFQKSRLHQPAAGIVEEDPEWQVTTVCGCIRACVRKSRVALHKIAAVAIDGQMAGILGVGPDGLHVTPYDSWLDTRCAPYIDRMHEAAGATVIQKTGGPPGFNHGPKILWWKETRPRDYRRIACFVQPAAYATMRLCGLDASQAFIDKTYLHFSGFADNPAGAWDPDLCRTFDVDLAKLPRIVDSRSIVGQVTPTMARRCGLLAGTPLVAGCGDTAASFLSGGATREGIGIDVAGTASVFAATTTTFTPDVTHRVLAWAQSATPGLWHPYAYINGGGMNLEWFVQQLAVRGRRAGAFEQLGRAAGQTPQRLSDPYFVPHWGGRNSPSQPHLRGCWAGLNWNHTAVHLYRAMLEAVALEYRIYCDILADLNPTLKMREVRVTGGGAQSDLWNKIKADALDLNVVPVHQQEGAPRGAALLAGFGVGLFSSLHQTAEQWTETGKPVRPTAKQRDYYAHRLARYQRLLDVMQDWAESL